MSRIAICRNAKSKAKATASGTLLSDCSALRVAQTEVSTGRSTKRRGKDSSSSSREGDQSSDEDAEVEPWCSQHLHHFLTAGGVGDEVGAAGVQGDTRRQGGQWQKKGHTYRAKIVDSIPT